MNWKTRTIWVGTGEVNSSRSSYAGTGIYKSKDNGKTWKYIGLPESHHIGKVQLHPTDDNTAWVAVLGHLYSPNKERGVYKTTDGGKTWKQTLSIDDNTGVVDLDINPQNPNELYAAAWYRTRRAWNFEEAGKTSGIYKSTDGGNTWTSISKAAPAFQLAMVWAVLVLRCIQKIHKLCMPFLTTSRQDPTPLKRTPQLTYWIS